MKKILRFAVPALFLVSALAGPGGEFWENKEYRQWSLKECNKLLQDSPWSKLFTLTAVGIGKGAADTSTDGTQPYVKYQVQFRSAKPLRQAVARQMQIAQKYDNFSPEQKQEFDKRAEGYISGNFADIVVVYVTYMTNDRNDDLELARYWQSRTVDLLKNSVYLTAGKGDKVPIARFVVSQGAERDFQFIFPRQVDGKPILDPQDKSLKLEFAYPTVGKIQEGRSFLEFKTEKMIFEGNIAY